MPTPTRKVITGTIISVEATPYNGSSIPIGRALSMRVNESYRVSPLYQLGQINAHELPILQYGGSVSINKMVIDLNDNILSQFKRVGAGGGPTTTKQFARQLLFGEGVNILVQHIIPPSGSGSEPTLPLDPRPNDKKTLMNIMGAVCTSESINIESNEVVVTGAEFLFREPIAVG